MFWIFIISLFALTQAGTVLPVQTSEVDVRQDHSGFSYNLKENHGVAAIAAAEPSPLVQPLVKTTIHIEDKPAEAQPQHHGQKIEARAHLTRKPEELLITQQLSGLPLEYYGYYYPYAPYSLPRAQYIPSLYSIPSIPYPYTLIRSA